MKNTGAKGRQNWATPCPFYDQLEREFGAFDVDVCAEDWSAKCAAYYTKADDGLSQDWGGKRFFCNLPSANPLPWLKKGYRHVRDDGSFGLYVLPATTDTVWFHDFASLGAVIFLRGRIQFTPPPGCINPESNNAGSMLVVYDQRLLVPPNGERFGTLARWAPRGPAQSTQQGAQLPLIGG